MFSFSVNILSKIHPHFNWILKLEKGLDHQRKCEGIADGGIAECASNTRINLV